MFPHVAGCVCFTFWDCYRLFWSRFGHDRAKNNSRVVFLAQVVNRLCDCMYAVVGSRDGGLVCLINLVCLETTQIELEGWISSPPPLNSTRREVRA